jgi:hypothetical protein
VAFKFLLRFTGLCAFVPHTSGQHMRVLLLGGHDSNGSVGNGSPHNGNGMQMPMPMPMPMEVHRPAIVFDKANLAPESARKPDLTFIDSHTVDSAVCLLEGQDVEILSNSASPFQLVGNGISAGMCPNGNDRNRLSWVAPMERIRPGTGQVDASCFSATGAPASISARVRLTQGTLRTSDISNKNGSVVRWRFLPLAGGATGHEQALAEVVELELDIPGDQVVLSTTPFRPGSASKPPITLVPVTAPDGTRQVVATIKCIPIEDLLGIRPVEPIMIGESRARDLHFENYFRISAADPGVGHGLVPSPVDTCPSHNHGAAQPPILHSPQCPPSFFEPSTAA